MSFHDYKKKKDKTVFNFIATIVLGFLASGMGAWAIVEFILYLVKDNPFNFTSLWLLGVTIVLEIIFFVRTAISD